MADVVGVRGWFGKLFAKRRLPLLVAWGASLTAVVLATVPNWGGRYDVNVAVLTATLITVIWYTYFTFQSVHARPLAYLRARVAFNPRLGAVVVPLVRNPMARPLRLRVALDVWVDGQPFDTGPFYRAEEETLLNPKGCFQGSVDLHKRLWRDNEDGSSVLRAKEVLVRFRCHWDDGFGDTGTTSAMYLRWELEKNPPYSVVGAEIEQRFANLPTFA